MNRYAVPEYQGGTVTITPREPRRPDVSYVCHLAARHTYFAHHNQCDGNSYTPSITDKGIPCTCTCHTMQAAA